MWRFVILIVALLLPGFARAEIADAAFRNGLAAFNDGSYARALEAWGPLAGAGDARAQTGLGFMYYSGRGVPRDSVRAAKFFQRAAEQGEPTAQLFLALMHYKSDGVPMSAPLAMMWVELAMAGGQVEAFQWRGIIMQSMTEAERDEAWRLLARWRETHRK
jgi:TPR repeat protein